MDIPSVSSRASRTRAISVRGFVLRTPGPGADPVAARPSRSRWFPRGCATKTEAFRDVGHEDPGVVLRGGPVTPLAITLTTALSGGYLAGSVEHGTLSRAHVGATAEVGPEPSSQQK